MTKLNESEVTRAPCPRFKECTHDRNGLELTLPVTMLTAPFNIALGPFNYEREPVQMVRCTTDDLLHDKYGIEVREGDVYQPIRRWYTIGCTNRATNHRQSSMRPRTPQQLAQLS